MQINANADTSKLSNRLISRKDVALLFGLHTETIKRWERRGCLTAIKVNSRLVRYRFTEVQNLIISSTVTQPPSSKTNLTLNSAAEEVRRSLAEIEARPRLKSKN